MPEGRVIRAVGGFYYLSAAGGGTVPARARGKFRTEGSIYVGDLVRYEMTSEDQAVIEEVKAREIVLKRPSVANVDRIVLVFALKDPDYNRLVIDRFLLLAEASGLEILLLFNKRDLVSNSEAKKAAEPYRKIGYKVLCTSTVTREGKNFLLREIREKVSVLSGPSGVGKSALINMVCPGYSLETGEVSRKIGRGRHTTRQAQLLPLPKRSGFIVDTPGFTQIDLDFIPRESLARYFPDLARHVGSCRFPGCLHLEEPDCGIKRALDEGEIYPWRYEHYTVFMAELKAYEENKYRRGKRSLKK